MNRRDIKVTWITFFALVVPCAGGWVSSATEKEALPIAEKRPPVSDVVMKDVGFAGTHSCRECHAEQYEAWSRSWHAKMLRKITPDIVVADFDNVELTYSDLPLFDGTGKQSRISPGIRLSRVGESFHLTLVDRDNAANNQTYPMGYTLGGHWEQQFEVAVGADLYPSPMRWVVEDREWRLKPYSEIWWIADGTPDGRPRKPEEMQPAQLCDAKCDGCHTGGLKPVKEGDRWMLPDRDGGLGVGCEKCHGPGGKHVEAQTPETILNPKKLNALQQNQVCGQCHSRVNSLTDPEVEYPLHFVPGGTDLQERVRFWGYAGKAGPFWPNGDSRMNRQQYHDVQKTDHARAGVTCVTCHVPHAPVQNRALLRIPRDGACRQCHVDSTRIYEKGPMAGADFTCTDCHMAKIGTRAGSTRKNREHWDVTAHTFKVMMPHEALSWNMRSSCDACHAGDERNKYGEAIVQGQQEVRFMIDEIRRTVDENPQSPGALKATSALSAVLLDGSLGAHHHRKAMDILTQALADAGGK